jgi:protein-disulfide isomerase
LSEKRVGGGARGTWPLFLGLPLIIAVAVAAVLLSGERPQPTAQERQSEGKEDRAAGSAAEPGHPSQGDADVPVVMIEYGDFRCTFCGKFAREVEPQLEQKYVESGTLRMEWRDFPYLGRESVDAALAARAAQEQGRFWEYHDLLYENQSGGFSEEKLVELAREAGLDVERFEGDLASDRFERAVAEDFQKGQEMGISGTPTFVINGRVVAGLQPVEVYEEAIERAKAEAERGG